MRYRNDDIEKNRFLFSEDEITETCCSLAKQRFVLDDYFLCVFFYKAKEEKNDLTKGSQTRRSNFLSESKLKKEEKK